MNSRAVEASPLDGAGFPPFQRRMMLIASLTGSHPVADAQVHWDAAHRRAAESAKADFAKFQRRIDSLLEADGM